MEDSTAWLVTFAFREMLRKRQDIPSLMCDGAYCNKTTDLKQQEVYLLCFTGDAFVSLLLLLSDPVNHAPQHPLSFVAFLRLA